MIVSKPDQPGVSETLAHCQIIRSNGAVIPFEPSKIAEAMVKAFMAVHGTVTERERPFFERASVWRSQIRLLALDFKRVLLVQATHGQRRTGTGAQVGADGGGGFFSAAKPNLRNAP